MGMGKNLVDILKTQNRLANEISRMLDNELTFDQSMEVVSMVLRRLAAYDRLKRR